MWAVAAVGSSSAAVCASVGTRKAAKVSVSHARRAFLQATKNRVAFVHGALADEATVADIFPVSPTWSGETACRARLIEGLQFRV